MQFFMPSSPNEIREVIGDCAKLEFKGEGHEFEDLKVLLRWSGRGSEARTRKDRRLMNEPHTQTPQT